MAEWQLDDPNVLGLIIGIIALGFAVVIFTLQYRIDRYVHSYVKRQDKIQNSIRLAAFGQIRNYLIQSGNEIDMMLDSREQYGNDEEGLSRLNDELSDSSCKFYGSAIKQQLTILTPYIDAQIRKVIDDTATSIEKTGEQVTEDQFQTEPGYPDDDSSPTSYEPSPPFPDEMLMYWESNAEKLSFEIQRLTKRIDKGDYE
ncbi:MAG TPA: hypothetical protein VGQ13_10190 [Nitrososphaera sp.]|jgi:hypothetical protein|nr:hypothetical protein [Nitrososphaera sp.]